MFALGVRHFADYPITKQSCFGALPAMSASRALVSEGRFYLASCAIKHFCCSVFFILDSELMKSWLSFRS
jgi:hypothetical protein